jgi:N4-(beta-N-acetylglucosaminyl)-L-asparaginase
VGSGLYVDQDFGVAGASGEGEEILKFCFAFDVVSRMKMGLSPQQAVEASIRDYQRVRGRGFPSEIALLAMDPQGRVGALLYGGTTRKTFPYFVWEKGRNTRKVAKKILLPARRRS